MGEKPDKIPRNNTENKKYYESIFGRFEDGPLYCGASYLRCQPSGEV